MTLLIGAIAVTSLLVGGIGVMNIMLVSVTERTGEIGVRMAVGATYGDIVWQFLIEAMVVCALGGVLGVLLAFGLGGLLQLFDIKVIFSAWRACVADCVLFFVIIHADIRRFGVVFWLYACEPSKSALYCWHWRYRPSRATFNDLCLSSRAKICRGDTVLSWRGICHCLWGMAVWRAIGRIKPCWYWCDCDKWGAEWEEVANTNKFNENIF